MRLLALVIVVALCCAPALAARRKRLKKRPKQAAPSGPVQVPIEIAAGPIALVPSPPAFGDQPVFFGLQLQMAAVVDRELIRQHKRDIPPWARGAAGNLSEVRVRPWWLALVPELLVISPQVKDTGLYGAVWRPLGVGVTLVDSPAFRVKANAALDAVALVLHSQTLGGGAPTSQSLTLVLRPGLNLSASAELPLTKQLLLSSGWSSDLFVPQALGRPLGDQSPRRQPVAPRWAVPDGALPVPADALTGRGRKLPAMDIEAGQGAQRRPVIGAPAHLCRRGRRR
jgi:hypothetical protein